MSCICVLFCLWVFLFPWWNPECLLFSWIHSTFSLVSSCIYSDASGGLRQDQLDGRQSICTRPSAACGESSHSAVGCSTAPQVPQWPHRKFSLALKTHDLQLCRETAHASATLTEEGRSKTSTACTACFWCMTNVCRASSLHKHQKSARFSLWLEMDFYNYSLTVEHCFKRIKQCSLKLIHFIETVASRHQTWTGKVR